MATMRLSVEEVVTRVSDFLGDVSNTTPTGSALTLATDIATRGLRGCCVG